MGKTVEKIIEDLTRAGLKLALAESCTGGMLASSITDIPGSSGCFEASYVMYSRAAKERMLGIPSSMIDLFGTVSEQTARLMAERALESAGAYISCSITGVAGPGPDSDGNPEGLVYIACSTSASGTKVRRFDFKGGRAEVRKSAVREAINLIAECIFKEGLA